MKIIYCSQELKLVIMTALDEDLSKFIRTRIETLLKTNTHFPLHIFFDKF